MWESGMIMACVFAFFLLLALVSFHPGDPGWSQAGLQLDVHNWVGATGAWVADLLLFSFGYLACHSQWLRQLWRYTLLSFLPLTRS